MHNGTYFNNLIHVCNIEGQSCISPLLLVLSSFLALSSWPSSWSLLLALLWSSLLSFLLASLSLPSTLSLLSLSLISLVLLSYHYETSAKRRLVYILVFFCVCLPIGVVCLLTTRELGVRAFNNITIRLWYRECGMTELVIFVGGYWIVSRFARLN